MSDFPPAKTYADENLMQGVALRPDPATVVNKQNWQEAPQNRWGFQHVQNVLATARISRGIKMPIPMESAPQNLSTVSFTDIEGNESSLQQLLDSNYNDAFLVMHKGKLIFEEYRNGMQRDSLHLLMSCTKSYIGTLAGIFIEQGLLDPEENISHYVPEFKDTALSEATLRQCLDMNAGVEYSEEYTDLNSHVRRFEMAYGWAPVADDYQGPRTQAEAMLSLNSKNFADGEKFQYRSCLTAAVGMAIEQVTGRRIQDLLAEYIWQPLGCEWDAAMVVDRENSATFDGGLNATARDWLRFGQMMAQGGRFNGKQVIPENWVKDCLCADDESRLAFSKSDTGAQFAELGYSQAAYRNQWWTLDTENQVTMASGINGQTLFIDAKNEVVIAVFSTFPQAQDIPRAVWNIFAMEAIRKHLSA